MWYRVNNQVVLRVASGVPDGPVAAYLCPFAESLSQQGYSRKYVQRQVMLAAGFSHWLEQRAVLRRSITSRHPTRYLSYRHRRRRPREGDSAALDHFIEFLRREKAIPAGKIPRRHVTPVEKCVRAYEVYLFEERALAQATVINYVPFVGTFLKERFGTGPVELSALRAADVIGFVQRQAQRLHLRRAKLLTTALRSFFRYARYRGEIRLDLATAVPCVANWSMPSIPRGIAPDQVRRLLVRFDRSTAVGRRDYAILLLARLGLRSGEVTFLELSDIDWKGGCLSIHGKGGRRTQLPLPKDVGDAIVAYLRRGRPRSASRRVFLTARAPVRGFLSQCAVGTIVRHAILRAGIAAPTTGAHQFRHGLATEMLRRGASLGQIGELLGHKSPETTKIYTKVDLKALHTLALPWPRGVR